MIELEQRLREAKKLPLRQRLEKCDRLAVEISVLLKTPKLDAAERIALTKLRAMVRDVNHWWHDVPQQKKGFPDLVTRGRKGKRTTQGMS